MIEHDNTFVENRRRFYENYYRVTESMDSWHGHAQKTVHAITRDWFCTMGRPKGSRVLNAGSGGSDYGIADPMLHLDLIAARVANLPNFLVGDISNMPVDNSSFDVILCVGSVLNYANPIRSIAECRRVLRPGGLLILEYERSGSPEYWHKHGLSSACARVDSFYGKQRTQLWVYGDEFIDGLLAIHGFRKHKEIRFHGLTSVILAITGSPIFAAKFVWGDQRITNIWPFSSVASNRILAVEKLAH